MMGGKRLGRRQMHAVISGRARQRRRLKYTCVGRLHWKAVELPILESLQRVTTGWAPRLFSGTLSFSYVFSVMVSCVLMKNPDG